METIIENLSATGLLEAAEANMVAFWTAYGRASGRELVERPDFIRVMTGVPVPLFNGVFRPRLARAAVKMAIEETQRAVARWQAPAFWWVAPGTEPDDLGGSLVAHGLAFAI